jgi:hypothetical protein
MLIGGVGGLVDSPIAGCCGHSADLQSDQRPPASDLSRSA